MFLFLTNAISGVHTGVSRGHPVGTEGFVSVTSLLNQCIDTCLQYFSSVCEDIFQCRLYTSGPEKNPLHSSGNPDHNICSVFRILTNEKNFFFNSCVSLLCIFTVAALLSHLTGGSFSHISGLFQDSSL